MPSDILLYAIRKENSFHESNTNTDSALDISEFTFWINRIAVILQKHKTFTSISQKKEKKKNRTMQL